MNNHKVGLIALLLLVIASLACGEVTVSNEEGEAGSVFTEISSVDDTSSLCPYNVAQIQKELANLSRMAQQGRDDFNLGLKMIEAQNVLADSSCTQEVTQFEIRETLEFANVSESILGVKSCYTSKSSAQNICRSTAALYDNDTSDCDINYEYEVNQCYSEFSRKIDRICANSHNSQACQSVKGAYQPR